MHWSPFEIFLFISLILFLFVSQNGSRKQMYPPFLYLNRANSWKFWRRFIIFFQFCRWKRDTSEHCLVWWERRDSEKERTYSFIIISLKTSFVSSSKLFLFLPNCLLLLSSSLSFHSVTYSILLTICPKQFPLHLLPLFSSYPKISHIPHEK